MGFKFNFEVLMYITGFTVLLEELLLVYFCVNNGISAEIIVFIGTLIFFITSLIFLYVGYKLGLLEELKKKKK